MLSPLLVVWRKEVRDALRDRRSLMSLCIFPVIGPLIILYMFNQILDTVEEAQDITLPVIGANAAPDLIDYLQQNGVLVEAVEPVAAGVLSPEQDTAVRTAIAERSWNARPTAKHTHSWPTLPLWARRHSCRTASCK